MKATFRLGVVALLGMLGSACGGASKPPMQPDSDTTASLGDGGADPAPAAAQPPAPAPPK